ncbi:MAG: FeoB-associated Cys-rich membrane protein [Desulfohalobiaceae bacterium]
MYSLLEKIIVGLVVLAAAWYVWRRLGKRRGSQDLPQSCGCCQEQDCPSRVQEDSPAKDRQGGCG